MPSYPIPGVGLGGLVPLSYPIPDTGLNGFSPSLTSGLGGLPLTKDDFRIYRAPMPSMLMVGPTTRPFAAPTEEPCLSYVINDQHDASRSCARRTRSQTAILAGNAPLRSNYCTSARRGFAASAAPAPLPKASFRSSLPPRLGRLGSTIPLGRHTLTRPTPALSPQLNQSLRPAAPLPCRPLLQITTPAPQLNTSQTP